MILQSVPTKLNSGLDLVAEKDLRGPRINTGV